MVAVGISGATGCIYGIRLLEALRALGQETELILSDWGAETIRLETGYTVEQVKALADRVYDNRNMAAQAASGSQLRGRHGHRPMQHENPGGHRYGL